MNVFKHLLCAQNVERHSLAGQVKHTDALLVEVKQVKLWHHLIVRISHLKSEKDPFLNTKSSLNFLEKQLKLFTENKESDNTLYGLKNIVHE